MRPLGGPAARIVNRNGVTGPIDKQLLSSLVFLAQHDFLLAPPALVQFAEARVAVPFRLGLPILFPNQSQRQVRMLLQLVLDRPEVWLRALRLSSLMLVVNEEGSFEALVVPILR